MFSNGLLINWCGVKIGYYTHEWTFPCSFITENYMAHPFFEIDSIIAVVPTKYTTKVTWELAVRGINFHSLMAIGY